ncbi:hypothetical protein FOL47_009347 [Perkinsus chesapeaki]|uniref:Uncharacterized protein n=1 Tax=Perkinsus chesapeaki TaxID=330153 RepID=A0A7J6L920_PERCH|nr:hypothetical protein FOL47_009347 [Perkinsus chesapeaki]
MPEEYLFTFNLIQPKRYLSSEIVATLGGIFWCWLSHASTSIVFSTGCLLSHVLWSPFVLLYAYFVARGQEETFAEKIAKQAKLREEKKEDPPILYSPNARGGIQGLGGGPGLYADKDGDTAHDFYEANDTNGSALRSMDMADFNFPEVTCLGAEGPPLLPPQILYAGKVYSHESDAQSDRGDRRRLWNAAALRRVIMSQHHIEQIKRKIERKCAAERSRNQLRKSIVPRAAAGRSEGSQALEATLAQHAKSVPHLCAAAHREGRRMSLPAAPVAQQG